MTNVIIAGYCFEDTPSYSLLNGERHITIGIPFNTERSIINELQDATEIQITDPLGREIIGTQRLVGWRSIQTFQAKNKLQYLITWAIPNPDDTEKMKKKLIDLTAENEMISDALIDLAGETAIKSEVESENDMLSDAILEIAELMAVKEELEEETALLTEAIFELAAIVGANE